MDPRHHPKAALPTPNLHNFHPGKIALNLRSFFFGLDHGDHDDDDDDDDDKHPGDPKWSQEEQGAARTIRRSHEDTGEWGEARRSQERQGTRRSQEDPGGHRMSPKGKEGARWRQGCSWLPRSCDNCYKPVELMDV